MVLGPPQPCLQQDLQARLGCGMPSCSVKALPDLLILAVHNRSQIHMLQPG